MEKKKAVKTRRSDHRTGQDVVHLFHGNQRREVGRVVREQQRRPMTRLRGALEGEVDPPEGNGGEGLSVRVLQDRVGHDDDRPAEHVRKDEDVELLETLVRHLVLLAPTGGATFVTCQVGLSETKKWWWCLTTKEQ